MRLHLQTWRWAPSKVSLDFNRLSRPHEIFILNGRTSPCYPEFIIILNCGLTQSLIIIGLVTVDTTLLLLISKTLFGLKNDP